ncbi:hypothetical protein [Streptomyces sp. NPDC020681]|uniref:hypothetical protein n=1 Tax=Streptomyces sp. NPDC020681 TaxID=3365083 RepID=UPI0037B7C6CB
MSSPAPTPKSPADIQLDQEGRIVINAPELAAALRSAHIATAGFRPTNGVCPIVNAVVGCGSGGPQM